MPICTVHAHSSDATARRCWERAAGKRADAVMKLFIYEAPQYEQIRYKPPALDLRGEIDVLIFYTGRKVR